MVDVMEEIGFQDTELGIIPIDWKIVALGSVSSITKLAGFEYSKYFNSYKDGGDIIVLRGTNITNNSLDLSDVRVIPRATSNNLQRSKLFKGDLVFAYVGTVGPVYLVKEDNKYHLGPNTSKITLLKNIDTYFIFNYFKSWLIKNEIFENVSIGAQPSLSMFKIRKFRIILPPTKTEQTAIANTLNDTDALITTLEKLINKKRAIKQGATQELLIPKAEWITKQLGDIFTFLSTASNSRADLSEHGEIAYIHYGDIHTKWNTFLDCNKNILPYIVKDKVKGLPFVQNGDLVIADASEDYEGLGSCVEIKNVNEKKIVAGLHTFLLRGNKDIIIDGFKGYFRSYHSVKKSIISMSTGVSVYSISKSKLKEMEIEIPQPQEQTRIAKILSDMDGEIDALEQKVTKYKLIKQGMMQNLLTGKIRLI